MRNLIGIFVLCITLMSGCITSNSKVKLTDKETGNSVTISEEGVDLDIQALEKDGIQVEIIDATE